MYYQIKDTLTECAAKDIGNRKIPYVANVSLEEFEEKKDLFDMDEETFMKLSEKDLV